MVKQTFSVSLTKVIKWILCSCLMFQNMALIAQIEVVPKQPEFPSNQILAPDSVACFKGGNALLFEYLESSFSLDDSLSDNNGRKNYTVVAGFIVDTAGFLSDIQIRDMEKSRLPATPSVRHELTRAIASMPAWKPCIKSGKPAVSMIYLPLAFTVKAGKMDLLKEEETVTKKKLGKEKWVIIIASVILVCAIAFLGVK